VLTVATHSRIFQCGGWICVLGLAVTVRSWARLGTRGKTCLRLQIRQNLNCIGDVKGQTYKYSRAAVFRMISVVKHELIYLAINAVHCAVSWRDILRTLEDVDELSTHSWQAPQFWSPTYQGYRTEHLKNEAFGNWNQSCIRLEINMFTMKELSKIKRKKKSRQSWFLISRVPGSSFCISRQLPRGNREVTGLLIQW